jgi:hypothetical protein
MLENGKPLPDGSLAKTEIKVKATAELSKQILEELSSEAKEIDIKELLNESDNTGKN